MTFKKLNNLENKVAVITGGAGQIGYATAIKLAEQKCRVIILTRNETEELKEKIKSLPNSELGHFFVIADITNTSTLKNAAQQVLIRAKRCDILVNSAASNSKIKPWQIEELTDDIFDDIIKTNLRGVYATIRTFFPMLRDTNDGLIINISSTAGERAFNSASNLAYGASKAGLNMLTRGLSRALAPKVRIIGIVPGVMEKPGSGIVRLPDYNEKAIEGIPLNRIGCGEDIANTIIACATHIRFATGSTIVVDGGRTA